MPTGALTDHIDVAQVALYVFWLFFIGLIYWIRVNDRREGYPLEREDTGWVGNRSVLLMGTGKTYKLPDGTEYHVPNTNRDTREVKAKPMAPYQGTALQPTGNPMLDGVGPAAYAQRHDTPRTHHQGRTADRAYARRRRFPAVAQLERPARPSGPRRRR